jgi:hypothetical protein
MVLGANWLMSKGIRRPLKESILKTVDVSKWPFRAFVVLSLVFSAVHGLLSASMDGDPL